MAESPKKEPLHFTQRPIERVPGAHFGSVNDMAGKRIESGDLVFLVDGERTIAVTVTKRDGEKFNGVIDHFESYDEEFYKGYRAGDSVQFVYAEIHQCLPGKA